MTRMRTFLLISLLLALTSTALASEPGDDGVPMIPPCSDVHGGACSPNGARTNCLNKLNQLSLCECQNMAWNCPEH